MSASPRVFAVVVLYGLAPEQSPAVVSLADLLAHDAGLYPAISGLIYDNSPSICPEDCRGNLPHSLRAWSYVHDSSNPGLAHPYQMALKQARADGCDWLLLLDQDTRLTAEYLREACTTLERFAAEESVAAVVPRLAEEGAVLSPHRPRWQSRLPLDYTPRLYTERVKVFNSGSLLRMRALEAIGGIPQEFPLDYLDHAIYHRLQQQGGRIYQMAAGLEHRLGSRHSDLVTDFAGSARLQSIVAAESRFYRLHGTPAERLRHSLSRLRLASRMVAAGQAGAALRLLRLTFARS